ncbi:MAG: dihydroorotase [Bacteroidetes bacterium]|nr:dihydroorotase [Bacteroidota bacterium]MCW5894337.1 dihydroorotase [Bacteroidota bacterium]
MNILLKNGRLIDPASGRDETCDIHIVDGRIEKLAQNISASGSIQSVDLKGKIIAPGFFDMHVHLREPGFEHKETILTGCTSAAAGGFTAVACMPNTKPAIDDESVIKFIHERAKVALNGLVDVYPIAAVTLGRKGEHLAPLAELASAGAVAFTDDGDPVHDAEIMRRALEYASMFKKPVIQHAQDLPLTKGGVMNEGFNSTTLGLPGMPSIAEDLMVARDIQLARYTNSQYHVAHMSTAGCVELVREAKRKGLHVTCEVTPHHFTLTDDAVRTYDTNTKMNPPLRSQDDVEAMKEGLKDGTIDVIATDHAPHSFDEKQVEFQQAPFGIVGLETAIGLAITELFEKNILSLYQLVEKFSTNPRRILHLPQIKIQEGESANLTLLDPSFEWKVDVQKFKSKSKNSPFSGYVLRGKAVGVFNNGRVYWN